MKTIIFEEKEFYKLMDLYELKQCYDDISVEEKRSKGNISFEVMTGGLVAQIIKAKEGDLK